MPGHGFAEAVSEKKQNHTTPKLLRDWLAEFLLHVLLPQTKTVKRNKMKNTIPLSLCVRKEFGPQSYYNNIEEAFPIFSEVVR